MPKIFSENQIAKIWDLLYKKNKCMGEICDILNCSLMDAAALSYAAHKRYALPKDFYLNTKEEKEPIVRPKAVYSNDRSTYMDNFFNSKSNK